MVFFFFGLVTLFIFCFLGIRKGFFGWLKIFFGGKGLRGGGWRVELSIDGGGIFFWGGILGCIKGNFGLGVCGISFGRMFNIGIVGIFWVERFKGGRFWGLVGGCVFKGLEIFGIFGGCIFISSELLGIFGGSIFKSLELFDIFGGCIFKILELFRIFGGWVLIILEVLEILDGRILRILELFDIFGFWIFRILELFVIFGGCFFKIVGLFDILFGIIKIERGKII